MILLRGLAHRAGTTAVILLVGLCAVGSAVVGPSYYGAARQSIVADTFSDAPLLGRGIEAGAFGPVSGLAARVDSAVHGLVNQQAGATAANRLFGAPTQSLESDLIASSPQLPSPHTIDLLLVWRSNVCTAVTMTSGACPTAAGEVMISAAMAHATHLKVGIVMQSSAGPVLVHGIYATPQPLSDVWADRGPSYFPEEVVCPGHPCSASTYDAAFTPAATLARFPAKSQGAAYEGLPLNPAHIRSADVPTLDRLAQYLLVQSIPGFTRINLQTTIPETISKIRDDWHTLSVPVTIVTIELLVLIWILLFVVVADAHEARSAEIALAKLRGYGRVRTAGFALGQPIATIVGALPLGTVVGWLAARELAAHLLRAGTPVPLPVLAWQTGAVATLGGLAAVVVGARAALFRPVIEQWRRTPRQGGRRGWVLDAIVATAALAGLAELVAGGSLSSTRHSPVALLVPGLLGLTFAVTSSRLVPILARGGYRFTRRRGIAPFLALRQIGRRPGAVRTTVVLTTATALAVFGACSWQVGRHNRERIAQLEAGAPTVLTVATRDAGDLAKLVDKIDPVGLTAAAVERATTGGVVTLAVQPKRFAAVANWTAAEVGDPNALLDKLDVASPPPILLAGNAVRVHATASDIAYPDSTLSIDIASPNGYGASALPLGTLHRHTLTATELLPPDTTLAGFDIVPPASAIFGEGNPLTGTVTISSIEIRSGGRWHALTGALSVERWRQADASAPSKLRQAPDGLQWTLNSGPSTDATIRVIDRPSPLPAIVTRRDIPRGGPLAVTGLDGGAVDVAATSSVSVVPGAAGTGGAVIDLDYAKLASYGNLSATVPQVWVRGDPTPIRQALERNGYSIIATTSSAEIREQLDRDGAGLASTLFAADAIFAAVLAAFATLLTMIVAARRRRHEFASLLVAGVRRRTLHAALALEHLVVIGSAAIAGVVAGGIAAAFVLRDVPEVTELPGGIVLHYSPQLPALASIVGGGVIALLLITSLAGRLLVRAVDPDQLRAAAP